MAEDREVLEGMIEDRVQSMLERNNQSLLKDIGSMMNKISHSSSSSVVDIPKFKRRSNEEQFKQNAKIISNIEEAKVALELENIQQAKESLLQAKEAITRRQKLIRLADSSEFGWRTVNEYQSNPLASDSEDKTRIYKAEARASRKAHKDKKRIYKAEARASRKAHKDKKRIYKAEARASRKAHKDKKRIYKAEARASRKAHKDKKKPNRSFPYKRPEFPAAPGSARPQSRPGACFACDKLVH